MSTMSIRIYYISAGVPELKYYSSNYLFFYNKEDSRCCCSDHYIYRIYMKVVQLTLIYYGLQL